MSEIKDGGPAFPQPVASMGTPTDIPGMSLRDWFAAMATDETVSMAAQAFMAVHSDRTSVSNAEARYFHADQMLQAREGGEK